VHPKRQAIYILTSTTSFVDLVSHEVRRSGYEAHRHIFNTDATQIRNPLGAIIHCADSITESLGDMSRVIKQHKLERSASEGGKEIGATFSNTINSSLEAVETISSCSAHLRLVVDDVLTLSKLDSNMLKIAPVAVSSGRFIEDIYRIFSVEAEREGVDFGTKVDTSIAQLAAEWVVIDPGRVTQVCSI